MQLPRLIERKRDGHSLAPDEWRAIITAYAAGEVPDYQMSALAMAVLFRGLAPEELAALTDAMRRSGEQLDNSSIGRPCVDKHSTGGVGDKTSLLLAPLVAACGVAVPMMSGRGLGHTGGTLDKLEAIPGFRTQLSLREAAAQLATLGCVMLGQTPEIVPADRKLYALRDVTGTVESIPLITASIMSKKLAEDLDALVLDVKTGSGAFLPDPAQAELLARTMISVGEANGCRTVALLTAMDRPLGAACGNALEVVESVAGLRGEGPPDLMEATMALAVEMLFAGGVAADADDARAQLERAIASGAALDLLRRLIEAQGGDPRVVDDPTRLPLAPIVEPWLAPAAGIVQQVEPRRIGHAIIELGGGRRMVTDAVDPAVGFVVPVKPGQRVTRGEPLAWIHARSAGQLDGARAALASAITIGEAPVTATPLIQRRLDRDA